MSSVRERRESISRDLDAFLGRLHGLRPGEWNLPTPDRGWEIRHLAAHLAGTIGMLNTNLGKIVKPDIAAALLAGDAVTENSGEEDIIESLTVNRNALVATLAEFTEEHLERETGDPATVFAPTGDLYLNLATCEADLHLYDINASLDHGSAGLSNVSIEAANETFGSAMIVLANHSEVKPDAPVSFHFDGASVDRWMSWNGSEWVATELGNVPVTRVRADDTALVLFVVGRIPATDHRLGVSGNREAIVHFKTWVPGP